MTRRNCDNVIGDALEWSHVEGLNEQELMDKMEMSRGAMDDAINDHTNMVRCCMARLTAKHIARESKKADER